MALLIALARGPLEHPAKGRDSCLYEAEALTTVEIADVLNVKPETVRRYLPGVSTTQRRRHDPRVLAGRRIVRAAMAYTLG